ncbi:MAG: TraR/DksA family transcriptional regulator [Elusimicrobiota bacterium]
MEKGKKLTVKNKKQSSKKSAVKKVISKKTKTESKLSESDIKSIKNELIKMRDNILSNIKSQAEYDMSRDIGDEMDDVEHTVEKETTFDLSSNEKTILKDIELALKKIDNKTYGICELCKNSIGAKRLKAIPYARYCIKCQIKQNS